MDAHLVRDGKDVLKILAAELFTDRMSLPYRWGRPHDLA